jgi:hypothetical protein
MLIHHHELEVFLDPAWWAEAGMTSFVCSRTAYAVDPAPYPDMSLMEIAIDQIAAVTRSPGVGIFNDNDEATARQRVVRLLTAFRTDILLPPVKVVEPRSGSAHRFKLVEGCHRLYCSLAVGCTHIPAVRGFNWDE